MSSSDEQGRKLCCFQEWLNMQESDLSEFLQARNPDPESEHQDDAVLTQLAEKSVHHFQDYINKRQSLARADPSFYFAPSWCSSLENSLLWIAGCRPSMFIRLVYALCGSNIESNLTQFLQGVRTGTGSLGELSASQLAKLNDLQRKTIREEDKLSSRYTSLQEDIADQPIALIANETSEIREENSDADRALDDHGRRMLKLMEDGDELRLSTVKELLSILTPPQALDFLVGGKKLCLCVHQWGKKRDHKRGRNN